MSGEESCTRTHLFNSVRGSVLPDEVQKPVLAARKYDRASGRTRIYEIGPLSSERATSFECQEVFSH